MKVSLSATVLSQKYYFFPKDEMTKENSFNNAKKKTSVHFKTIGYEFSQFLLSKIRMKKIKNVLSSSK